MDWKKISPSRWFQKEQEEDDRAIARSGSGDPIAAMRSEMDRAFEETFRRFGAGPLLGSSRPWPSLTALERSEALLRPNVDISEGKKAYTVRVEVPGVGKDDISLDVDQDILRVRGEKKQERKESEDDYHWVERTYGRFERVLSLPEDADATAIAAKSKNGVLIVTIPKRKMPEKEERKIEIEHD